LAIPKPDWLLRSAPTLNHERPFMKLDDALPLLQNACGKRFCEIFAGHPVDLRTNKGHAGQLLLQYIGLHLDSNLCDFEDGELKTNKSLPSGAPLETMFITQISEQIETLVCCPPIPFENSHLYQKIRNLVYLPVVKQSADAGQWYYIHCIRVRAEPGSPLFRKLKADYDAICVGLRCHIETSPDGFIHTTNGPHYIQVRSKDSTPYHPIYSRTYSRYVSNKNHAFYFMKQFMLDAAANRL
jgi:DNA mismatch repair protein MutH